MYICTNCQAVFNEMPEAKEPFDFEDNATIADNYCCYDSDIVEAEKCAECGEWHDPADMEENLCSECRTKVQKALESFIETFSAAEQEYARDCLICDF